MNEIDWNAPTIVHCRSDGGSEMYFDFDKLDEGPLHRMVRRVAAMSGEERARIIFDVSGRGNLDIGQVMALHERPDLPA